MNKRFWELTKLGILTPENEQEVSEILSAFSADEIHARLKGVTAQYDGSVFPFIFRIRLDVLAVFEASGARVRAVAATKTGRDRLEYILANAKTKEHAVDLLYDFAISDDVPGDMLPDLIELCRYHISFDDSWNPLWSVLAQDL